ncbi:GTPase [Coprinopsis cinerea AmutBmut pab1-1]|nr:GTPase [Coprinopsis cinerea AmutBmut pab1-1]
MPPRRKPISTKQKKAEQQLRRAIKRGDVPAPEPTKKPPRKRKGRVGPTGSRIGAQETPNANIESARRLQSAFVKVSTAFLEETKVLASNLSLTRPVPASKAIFDDANNEGVDTPPLTCPKRPKWRFDMTKDEVEHNEEGLFKKWIAEHDSRVEQWRLQLEEQRKATGADHPSMPPSITHFERNLEVWRQLWRVTEISELLLVLLDSRCPTLHYPPALSTYLEKKRVVLVLTKVDISGLERVEAWKSYLHQKHPGHPIVEVESYVEKEATAVHQGKKQYEPHIPTVFRERLIAAIRQVHGELLTPPERVQSDPEKLKNWVPPVKSNIDWTALFEARGEQTGLHVGSSQADAQRPGLDEDNSDDGSQSTDVHPRQEPDFLTIGLIGQPNVGKSSLLNALFGARKVRASKTPGKTKHFQTMFWTSDVRLVDCPGLVMPNYTPMEMQVLSGILPISRVSAIPACIHYAAQLLPLERVLRLEHPSLSEPAAEDKRTWREGMRPSADKPEKKRWTAMEILTAYANAKGWVTAKAGRPDVHRAGNAILRALAEGRIHWAFWPPGSKLPEDDLGIWIPHDVEESEAESDDQEDDNRAAASDAESEAESAEDEGETDEEEDAGESGAPGLNVGIGRFGALSIVDDDESEGSED